MSWPFRSPSQPCRQPAARTRPRARGDGEDRVTGAARPSPTAARPPGSRAPPRPAGVPGPPRAAGAIPPARPPPPRRAPATAARIRPPVRARGSPAAPRAPLNRRRRPPRDRRRPARRRHIASPRSPQGCLRALPTAAAAPPPPWGAGFPCGGDPRRPREPLRSLPFRILLKPKRARQRKEESDARRAPTAYSLAPRFKLRRLPPSPLPLYCRMFPHPGTRIAQPTNGRLPPSGRVLEASANKQAQRRVAGRALRGSSRYWGVGKEGATGGLGTGEKKGTAAGGRNRAGCAAGARAASGRRHVAGGGAERLRGGACSGAPWWPSPVLREVASGSNAPSFLFAAPHAPAPRPRRPAGTHPSSGAPPPHPPISQPSGLTDGANASRPLREPQPRYRFCVTLPRRVPSHRGIITLWPRLLCSGVSHRPRSPHFWNSPRDKCTGTNGVAKSPRRVQKTFWSVHGGLGERCFYFLSSNHKLYLPGEYTSVGGAYNLVSKVDLVEP